MEKQQRITENELAEIQTALAALSKQLAELNVNFEAANKELDALQTEAGIMSKRLAAASKLIDGLTGERERWGVDVGNLGTQRVKLVGDCLLGSSFLSYLGAFTAAYRKDLTYDKFLNDIQQRNIPVSDPFSLEKLLTTDATIQVRAPTIIVPIIHLSLIHISEPTRPY